MTQTVLGEAIGVSFEQVQKYETGKDRIAARTLKKLAEVLGIHPGRSSARRPRLRAVSLSCGKP